MAGNADVSYDDDQQQAVAPKVTETWDAMTGSRKRTSALGAAQQNVFWGVSGGRLPCNESLRQCSTKSHSSLNSNRSL